MIRRSEVPHDLKVPGIKELLVELVDNKDSFACMNYAICIAAGFQCEVNWELADNIISNIDHPSESIDWWYELVLKQDPEGDLVVGWLVRHRLINDPDKMTASQRMERARAGGWLVPKWMDEMVSNIILKREYLNNSNILN